MITDSVRAALFSALLLLAPVFPLQTPALAQQQHEVASDDLIADTVRQKLASDQVVKGGALEVAVKDGTVTLSGAVASEKVKARAERLARGVKGVRQVVNKLAVRR